MLKRLEREYFVIQRKNSQSQASIEYKLPSVLDFNSTHIFIYFFAFNVLIHAHRLFVVVVVVITGLI